MEEQKKSSSKNTGMAVVAYILFFIPLLTDSKKDPFVKFHVRQGLLLFLGYIVYLIVIRLPIIGWFSPILGICLFILLVIGIMNAVNGREKPLPIIGDLAKNFKI